MNFMNFAGGLFGLSDYQSQAFAPKDVQFSVARNKVQEQANKRVWESISKIGTGLGDAFAAYNYQKKAAAAKAAAYRNAQVVAQAQMESTLKLAQYESDRRIEASQVLEGNIPNMMLAADQTREQGRRMQAQRAGEVQARYASSGLLVGTGSARLVFQDVLSESDKSITNQYKSSLNEMRDVANAAMKERLEAQFAVWSAEEQNRFYKANVDQRLS